MHRSFAIVALGATGLFASTSTVSAQTTRTVCASGCQYTSINEAIQQAANGDTIQLAAELYLLGGEPIDPEGKEVRILGVTEKDGSPGSYISAEGLGTAVVCDGGETRLTVFENLEIRRGVAFVGGGFSLNQSSPTIRNCRIESCGAEAAGGGLSASGGSPLIEDCAFVDCSASIGGAISIQGSIQMSIVDCTFERNEGFVGSAIIIGSGSQLDQSDCLFTRNKTGSTIANSGTITGSGARFCGNDSARFSPIGDVTGLEVACMSVEDDCGDCPGPPVDGTLTVCYSGCHYDRIPHAIANAESGEVVQLAATTYLLEGESINPSGKAVTVRGTTDSAGRPTSVINGQNLCRIVVCESGEGPGTEFVNLRLHSGLAFQTDPEFPNGQRGAGGGFSLYAASPTIRNCEIIDCNAEGTGGGLFATGGAPTLADCTFQGCASSIGGAMVLAGQCDAELSDCSFVNNEAFAACAIMVFGNAVIDHTDCRFIDNGPGTVIENQGTMTGTRTVICGGNGTIGGDASGVSYACISAATDCTDCTDADEDGISDEFDQCPDGDDTVDVDENGIPDACESCPGDVDGDGEVDGADLAAVLGWWGTDESSSDLDGDGEVDGADLAFVLGYWGGCS